MTASECPVVLLAAGGSRRFGTPKGLAELRGVPLIDRVMSVLSNQTVLTAINCALDSPYAKHSQHIVPDVMTGGLGPLAGIHAAMVWAESRGYSEVITAPVDTPFLPDDYVARLLVSGDTSVAVSDERLHPICGLWSVATADRLATAIEAGLRAAYEWADEVGAKTVAFEGDPDPFFNVNTPEDLVAAEQFLALRA